MKKDDSVYLRHIMDAFLQIEHYTDGITYEAFLSNRLVQDGVIRQLEVMGEAARNISDDLQIKNPAIPWRQMISLRNRIIHAYFNVNFQIIWEIIQVDIPEIKQEIKLILENEYQNSEPDNQSRHNDG
jgi:uncharacterized protein with HEPN domain